MISPTHSASGASIVKDRDPNAVHMPNMTVITSYVYIYIYMYICIYIYS